MPVRFGSRAVVSGGRPGAHFAAPAAATAEDEDDDEDLDFGSITTLEDLSWKTALGIGCFQVLSLIPGTSRSGSTIIGGLLFGLHAFGGVQVYVLPGHPCHVWRECAQAGQVFHQRAVRSVPTRSPSWAWAALWPLWFRSSLSSGSWTSSAVTTSKCFGVYRIVLGIVVLAYFFVLEPMLDSNLVGAARGQATTCHSKGGGMTKKVYAAPFSCQFVRPDRSLTAAMTSGGFVIVNRLVQSNLTPLRQIRWDGLTVAHGVVV